MSGSATTKYLTVCGGGVLGTQIAWHSAYQGKDVMVYGISEEALENCRNGHKGLAETYQEEVQASSDVVQSTQDRIGYSTDLGEAVANADVVIEAIPEVPELKTKLYQQLTGLLKDHTILATNSSTLLPSMFADATDRSDRYCALHFANRIWDLNVAEVMAHPGTSEETLTNITRFAIEIGMVPIPLQKEQSGYVVNSLLIPMLHAAQTLVTNEISDPETVDKTFMIMNRGVKNGPFAAFDFIGMGTVYNIFSYWGTENGDEQMLANAAYLKEHFIDKGLLGVQTGQGYYSYPEPSFMAADFLDIPDAANAEEVARLSFPHSE